MSRRRKASGVVRGRDEAEERAREWEGVTRKGLFGRVVLVGNAPPPMHGAAVMGMVTREALEATGREVVFVDKTLSQRADELRKWGVGKLKRYCGLQLQLSTVLKDARRRPVIVFMMVSRGLGLWADLVSLCRLYISRHRVVLYLHGKNFPTDQRGVRRLFWRKALAWVFGRAAGIVCVSRAVALRVKEIGAEARKVWVVPNAVAPVASGREGSEERAAVSGDGDVLQVLYLGALRREKGVWDYVHCAVEVSKDSPEVVFCVAGGVRDEAFFECLRRAAADVATTGKIRFLGEVVGRAKWELLRESDIVVVPSYEEAFGLVAAEAMAVGKPVVAYAEGGLAEVVVDGVTGLLVKPGDVKGLESAIRKLVGGAKLRRELGEKGKQRWATEYSMEIFRERWAKVLRKIDSEVPAWEG